MKKGSIKDILARLSGELQRSQDVDGKARQKMQDLHRDIERIDEAQGSDLDSLWDRAKELEAQFAAEHPTLERIARELADAIAKMGV